MTSLSREDAGELTPSEMAIVVRVRARDASEVMPDGGALSLAAEIDAVIDIHDTADALALALDLHRRGFRVQVLLRTTDVNDIAPDAGDSDGGRGQRIEGESVLSSAELRNSRTRGRPSLDPGTERFRADVRLLSRET